MRNTDYSDRYQQHFTLGSDISTRDRDGIHKTFSGLMKLIYPDGKATQPRSRSCSASPIEGRKRVKDQILRIDSTDGRPSTSATATLTGTWHGVTTLEEDEYPDYYHHIVTDHGWKISLDRGLDIFQHYEMNDAFTFANRLQQYRPCKAFEVTFIKHKREAEGE
jgi:hypothetical protein